MIKSYFTSQATAVTEPSGEWLGEGQVFVGRSALYKEPNKDSMQVSQLVFGERYDYYASHDAILGEHWYLVQSQRDGYVGYMYCVDLVTPCFVSNAKVNKISTALYASPSVTSPVVRELPFGAELYVETEETFESSHSSDINDEYYFLPYLKAWIYKQHLQLNHDFFEDPVALARQFIGLSYLWGGRSGWGVDCSSLVQLCYEQCGCLLPRDTDLQEKYLPAFESGTIAKKDIQKNDLLYWPGHVAIISSASHLVHATGFGMQVIEEPIDAVCQRIYKKYKTQCAILRPILPIN